MLLKQKPSKATRKWICSGFITLGIYTPLEARVYYSSLHELPIDMGNSICTAH